MVKNPRVSTGDARDLGSISGSGKSLEKKMEKKKKKKEKENGNHSSILVGKIPFTEEAGLQSKGLQRVRHD